jgi:hypothetical protein
MNQIQGSLISRGPIVVTLPCSLTQPVDTASMLARVTVCTTSFRR